MLRSALSLLAALALSQSVAAKGGICLLYTDSRSYYFSGVSPAGDLAPLLLTMPWGGVFVGLDAGEDDDTFYITPEGVGSNPNMTIATLRTNSSSHTASVSYAALGAVPGYDAPVTYPLTLNLDASRSQMIAILVGADNLPPLQRARGVGDVGDLFLVLADIFPANGSISRVWLDLSAQDMRWGDGGISGQSTLDGSGIYWVEAEGGNVPSGQALYGFPLNGSTPAVVPIGAVLNLDHLFYSEAQGGMFAVFHDDTGYFPTLARFTPPSAKFETVFAWGNVSDAGTYDVSTDGSLFLAVVFDTSFNPFISIVNLKSFKEVSRIAIRGFSKNRDIICDVNFCNL